jgi:hypothetical protein
MVVMVCTFFMFQTASPPRMQAITMSRLNPEMIFVPNFMFLNIFSFSYQMWFMIYG